MRGLTVGLVYSYETVDQLRRCLVSLEHQREKISSLMGDLKIILIRTPKSKTRDLSFFSGTAISSDTENLAFNRNLILQSARTEAIYLTDPDCWQDEETLTTLCQKFREKSDDTSVFAIAGPNLSVSSNRRMNFFFQWLGRLRWLNGGLSQIVSNGRDRLDWHAPTCNILYFKSRLEGLSFSEKFPNVGEDLEFHFRLQQSKKKIFVCGKGHVWHEQPASLSLFLKKTFRYGIAQTLLLKTHPSSFQNHRIWILFGSLAMAALASFAPFQVAVMSVLFVGGVGTSLMLAELVISKAWARGPRLLGAWLAVAVSYLLGQLVGLICPRRYLR